jgi:hypothetical protein
MSLSKELLKHELFNSDIYFTGLHLVVVVGLVRLCDLESNAGGSLTTSRATHASKVKG